MDRKIEVLIAAGRHRQELTQQMDKVVATLREIDNKLTAVNAEAKTFRSNAGRLRSEADTLSREAGALQERARRMQEEATRLDIRHHSAFIDWSF